MKMIGAIASALSPKDYDLREERREHVWQMQLLGDPMLQLSLPQEVSLSIPKRAVPGETITISGTTQASGSLMLEFGFRREQARRELDAKPVSIQSQQGRDEYQKRYQAANQRILLRGTYDHAGGEFELSIPLPEELANGKYCVRMFLAGAGSCEVGYEEISVRKPKPTTTN